MHQFKFRTGTAAMSLLLAAAGQAYAQTGFGVSSRGDLVSFDLASPGATTTIGNLGFTPESIDFRPGTLTLYALDVGPVTSRIYTVNPFTGTAAPVGAGFASVGVGYDLTGAQSFGFDFNPKTLQADGSIRIRLTASGGSDLRLHSGTGGIAAVDGMLDFPGADANGPATPNVVGSAYINNFPTIGGPTTLFDIDAGLDILVTQNPPNNGTLNTLAGGGALGINVSSVAGFDIFTDGMLFNSAYGALQLEGESQQKLFKIDLGTGAASLIGAIGADVSGGFAIAPVPEVTTVGAAAFGGIAAAAAMWRRRKTA